MLGLMKPAQPTASEIKLSRNELFQLRPGAHAIDMLKMRIEGQQRSTVFQAAGVNPQVIGRNRFAFAAQRRIYQRI